MTILIFIHSALAVAAVALMLLVSFLVEDILKAY